MPEAHGPEQIEHLREGSLTRDGIGAGVHVEGDVLCATVCEGKFKAVSEDVIAKEKAGANM